MGGNQNEYIHIYFSQINNWKIPMTLIIKVVTCRRLRTLGQMGREMLGRLFNILTFLNCLDFRVIWIYYLPKKEKKKLTAGILKWKAAKWLSLCSLSSQYLNTLPVQIPKLILRAWNSRFLIGPTRIHLVVFWLAAPTLKKNFKWMETGITDIKTDMRILPTSLWKYI